MHIHLLGNKADAEYCKLGEAACNAEHEMENGRCTWKGSLPTLKASRFVIGGSAGGGRAGDVITEVGGVGFSTKKEFDELLRRTVDYDRPTTLTVLRGPDSPPPNALSDVTPFHVRSPEYKYVRCQQAAVEMRVREVSEDYERKNALKRSKRI